MEIIMLLRLLVAGLLLLNIGAATAFENTDTTTFKANSREVAHFQDQYGEMNKNVPCPCIFDQGRYFYQQEINAFGYVWSCREYNAEGLCLDIIRHLPEPYKILAFVANWQEDSEIFSDLIQVYNAEHQQQIELVNVDEQPALIEQYHLTEMPVLLLLKDQTETGRLTGLHSRSQFSQWLEQKQK
jgi:hypothetical protein